MKPKIFTAETKAAVKEIDDLFMKVIRFISYQEGEDLTLAECLKFLNERKHKLPAHVFYVLYCLLDQYTMKFLSKGNYTDSDVLLGRAAVCKEVCNYAMIAKSRVLEEFVDFVPENMVFGEMYALVYKRYLEEVLKAW